MMMNAFVHLRSAGVCVLLDLADAALPSVVHWGADLGDLDLGQVQALAVTRIGPTANNQPTARRRLSVLPDQHAGWLGRPGISGSRDGRAWSPAFTVRSLTLGQAATAATEDQQLVTATATSPAGCPLLVVEAADDELQLVVKLEFDLGAGGVLRVRVTLTNQADAPYGLNDLVVVMPVPGQAREVLDFAGHWAKERTPQRHQLVTGTHLRENRRGRTGADAATLLHLGEPGFSFATGEIWAVHTGWSGNHTHYAERLSTGEQLIGGGELLLPGEVRLGRDQSYSSPWVYFGHGVGLDQVARRFHSWLRGRPQHVGPDRPVTLNVWEAVYFDHDLERLTDLADRAAALGVERFVLDDGWFSSRRNDRSGLGDWTVSAEVWPDGLHPLVDKVTSLGMQFGLWFEPEMVNPDSDVARAHPDWIMSARSRWPIESRHQQVVNLGIEACYTYVRDAMLAILAEYDIAYIKWDHNRDLIEAGSQPDGAPGVHAQTEATYRLIDELKAAHPGLEIESCSSGGARVDLGILERTDRVWVSDCIDPLERCQMNRWTAQLIGPELMGSHIASGRSHTTARRHDLSFRAATAVFGHLGIEWDLAKATDAELAELADWITFYKSHRHLLLDGDLVRVDHPDPTVWMHGVVAHDRSQAIFSLTAVARSESATTGLIRFPGMDPERSYRLEPVIIGEPPHGLQPPAWWLAGGVDLPGRALVEAGLEAPSVHPEQTVLFRLIAIRAGVEAHPDESTPSAPALPAGQPKGSQA